MIEILTAVMRCLHIASAVTLLGGMVYARLVMIPSEDWLPEEAHTALDESAAHHFRPVVIVAIAGLVLSGIFNYLIKPGRSFLYLGLFGMKVLLALHIFAIALLIAAPRNKRRKRQLMGAAISGLIILFISAYLRGIA
jgi:uncharacterized membrane protein